MEPSERIAIAAALLREMVEEEIDQVFKIAQVTQGWMRIKKDRIIPVGEGGVEGSDQWWQYADELHLPALGVDGSLAALINYDKKEKLWFIEVTDGEGFVAFDDLYAAMEFAEAQATENGWSVKFCGVEDEEEEGELDADELTADDDAQSFG